jgi:hypothetical protein
LEINVVCGEEIGPDESDKPAYENDAGQTADNTAILDALLKSNKIPFDAFKNRMNEEGVEGAEDWKDVRDVPTTQIFVVMGKVKERLEKLARDKENAAKAAAKAAAEEKAKAAAEAKK